MIGIPAPRSSTNRVLATALVATVAVAAAVLQAGRSEAPRPDQVQAAAAVAPQPLGLPDNVETARLAVARAIAAGKAQQAALRAQQLERARNAQLAELAKQRRERAAQRRASRDRRTAPVSYGSPRAIARSMLAGRGWSSQFGCLDALWQRESGWRTTAASPSGAYGIPQALPGRKMASAGADWRTNPATQIRWGLGYIGSRYGGPCAAWSHAQSTGWY